jgi:peroxin-5
VDRDPYSPEALLALGVSYVNELNHARAIETLKAWIKNNPKFAGLELEDDLYGAAEPKESGMESAFDEVQQLLLRALEFDPKDAADVLEALGVVYNVSRDYDAAVDAFQKAIELRPDDYQLWNKLGATLANGNQSAKALPAYHRALQLKPKYARVWLNMAISHSNLQNYEEAARCYLQTLSLNPSAIHCWSYLRIALSCSERWDLLPLATSQDLDSFKEHFDFVMYNSSDGTEMYKSGDGTAAK